MGSRLSLNFNSLLNNPNVSVEFYAESYEMESTSFSTQYENIQSAKVTFKNSEEFSCCFDVTSLPEGKYELSCDFNFFRYKEGDTKLVLLRSLYEEGICFRVTH